MQLTMQLNNKVACILIWSFPITARNMVGNCGVAKVITQSIMQIGICKDTRLKCDLFKNHFIKFYYKIRIQKKNKK